MSIRIVEEPVESLVVYGEVSIAFRVESGFRVEAEPPGTSGFRLREEPVQPYLKDYDAQPSNGPGSWMKRWDLRKWGILAAYLDSHNGERRVGGAVIAWKTPGIDLLSGRDDRAVLWDLRVHPDFRGADVGSRLFLAAEAWSRTRGCRRMVVETQNVNVAACRFYERQGCTQGEVHPFAYPELPDEVQMLWYKVL